MATTTTSPLEVLQYRLKSGLTSLPRLQLAASLNRPTERACVRRFLRTLPKAPTVDTPAKHDIKSLGEYLLQKRIDKECRVRFALVCAEALLPNLAKTMRQPGRLTIDCSYARLSVPANAAQKKLLVCLFARLNRLWSKWLESMSRQGRGHEVSTAPESAYLGMTLCLTCVQENLDANSFVLITDPEQIAAYVAQRGDHRVFWQILQRDFLPWLIGGLL